MHRWWSCNKHKCHLANEFNPDRCHQWRI
jgi:hypothetical protein